MLGPLFWPLLTTFWSVKRIHMIIIDMVYRCTWSIFLLRYVFCVFSRHIIYLIIYAWFYYVFIRITLINGMFLVIRRLTTQVGVRHRWSAPVIGTDDRHLPLFVHCICYRHVFPKDSAIWVPCPASLWWCMTPSTSRRWHQSRSNPILWIGTQMVERQMQNRLAHFRERLKTAIIGMLIIAILSRAFCKTSYL